MKWEYIIYSEKMIAGEEYSSAIKGERHIEYVGSSQIQIPDSDHILGLRHALGLLGSDGWELCASNTIPDLSIGPNYKIEMMRLQYIFKRRVEE